MNMDFGENKTPVEVIKEEAFGWIYVRDIYSGINGKWYRKSWKDSDELQNDDQNYYCSNYYDVNVNKYCAKCETSLKFWENEGWIDSINPYGCFQWYFRYWLGRRSLDDKRQIARWKGIVNRFKGKLIKTIKDVNGRFDDYLISPKIRQISQQTFVLMKTSWRRLSSSSSSEDVFNKTSWSTPKYSSRSYVFKAPSKHFQDVFKTTSSRCKISWRRLQNVFKTSCKIVFKTSSRRFQRVSSS